MVDRDFNGSDVLTEKLKEGYEITSAISVNGQGWYVVESERESDEEWKEMMEWKGDPLKTGKN